MYLDPAWRVANIGITAMYTGHIGITVRMKHLYHSRSNTWRGMSQAFLEDLYMFSCEELSMHDLHNC
jgi:hypothetical protein